MHIFNCVTRLPTCCWKTSQSVWSKHRWLGQKVPTDRILLCLVKPTDTNTLSRQHKLPFNDQTCLLGFRGCQLPWICQIIQAEDKHNHNNKTEHPLTAPITLKIRAFWGQNKLQACKKKNNKKIVCWCPVLFYLFSYNAITILNIWVMTLKLTFTLQMLCQKILRRCRENICRMRGLFLGCLKARQER